MLKMNATTYHNILAPKPWKPKVSGQQMLQNTNLNTTL